MQCGTKHSLCQATLPTLAAAMLCDADLEAWLEPLKRAPPPATSDHGRELCLALAHEQGVRLFDAVNVATASAAAAHFEEHGFCILIDALTEEELIA